MTLLRCTRSWYVSLTLYEEILEKRRYKQGQRGTQEKRRAKSSQNIFEKRRAEQSKREREREREREATICQREASSEQRAVRIFSRRRAEQSMHWMLLLKTHYERTKAMPTSGDELSQEGRRNGGSQTKLTPRGESTPLSPRRILAQCGAGRSPQQDVSGEKTPSLHPYY